MNEALAGTIVRTLTLTGIDYGNAAYFAGPGCASDPLHRRNFPGHIELALTWEEWLAEGKPTDLVVTIS